MVFELGNLKPGEKNMDEEMRAEIFNKMTLAMVILEKMSKGETVPQNLPALALSNLQSVVDNLKSLNTTKQ